MKTSSKTNINYIEGVVIILVSLLLTAYCRIVGFSLIMPLLLLLSGIHLFLHKKADTKLFLYLGLLLVILIAVTNYIVHYTAIQAFYIPVASITMLTILLFNDLHLTLIMSFLSSTMVTLIAGGELSLMLIFFVGSLTSAYTIRDARTRGKLIGAGFYVGMIQVFCIILFHPEIDFVFSRIFVFNYLRPLFLNGLISAFVVMTTLKIFEMCFGVLTNFSLLELSDKDRPLLKRMSLEAPGTYHHSMLVSDLAESAADAIGANALLTRVGAYYHDIGKIDKAEYYTENQIDVRNKHDTIEPSVSRLVILNHVKEGVELARQHKLNGLIIDFIPQHHGTGLMYYFYQRALESAQDPSAVNEEDYRYPGPKPQTRETAIVLLADSVEGATRALEEPSPKKIEETVRKIINNKFIDGQLDECNLTLKEINLIAETFARVLSAIYHTRLKYPENKNDDSNTKSAEENTPDSRPDSQDHRRSSDS